MSKFTKMQSSMVVKQAAVADNSDVFVIDLTARPFALGVKELCLFMEGLDVGTAATVVLKLNSAADGSGDDTVIDTKALAIGDPQSLVIETDFTELGFKLDKASAESLVVAVTGEITGMAALVIKPMDCYFGMNPTAV